MRTINHPKQHVIKRHNRPRYGFSLLELAVVLAILAALATVALRAVSSTQNQSRYQQTTTSLNNVQDAIVGPANQHNPDGTPLVTGFVADIGRPPNVVVSPSDPLLAHTPPQAGDPFNELLSPSNSPSLAGYPSLAYYQSSDDSTVKIAVGWQGPYIRLGAGQSYIRDGWGNSFQYTPGAAGTGSTVTSSGSGGSDIYSQQVSATISGGGIGSPFASLYGHMKMITAVDTVGPNTGNPSNNSPPNAPNPTYYNGTTSVQVAIWVCYFGPDLSQASPRNPVVAIPVKVADNGVSTPPTDPAYWPTANSNGFGFILSGSPFSPSPALPYNVDSRVTIGSRVLKAYVVDPSVVNALNILSKIGLSPSSSGPIFTASNPIAITATGGNQSINLTLPHYSP